MLTAIIRIFECIFNTLIQWSVWLIEGCCFNALHLGKFIHFLREINMKFKILSVMAIMAFAVQVNAGTVRIHNNDSKTHVVKLKCSGSSKNLQVSGSSTSSYTFHSTASSCDIVGGSVDFPVSKLENGQSWKFKNNKSTQN